MITLEKSIIEKNDNFVIIQANIEDNGLKRKLFYAVDLKYENYIDKTLNPFIFWALLIAMYEKKDLRIDGPCSQRFIYGIKTLLLPAIERMGLYAPKIDAPEMLDDCRNITVSTGCATGLSGGIDSLCTVVNHVDNDELKLTHLFQFFPDYLTDDLQTKKFHHEENNNLKEYNDELSKSFNLPVVKVYSNFTENVKFQFGQYNSFCFVSHAMLLNGLISKYILASGYSIENFGLNFDDTSHYDLLTCQVVNRPDFEMISYQPVFNRIDKTLAIADNEIVQKHVNTCIINEIGEKNCTIDCFKCKRTVVTLDILGKLDRFKDSYDIQLYYKNKTKIWGDIFYRAYVMHDSFAEEIVSYIKEHSIKKPFGTTYHVIAKGLQNQAVKLKRILK